MIPLNDPTVEDYWFLIVNRRALENEIRKIRLVVNIDTTFMNYPYYLDYVLGDSTRIAEPCQQRIPSCANRFVDVILQPGEAELVHFYRGEFGCDTTLAHIRNLTAARVDQGIRLDWEKITMADDSLGFVVDQYFIYGANTCNGPWIPIGVTDTTCYVDSVFAVHPKHYYTVQACGRGFKGQLRDRSGKTSLATKSVIQSESTK